MIQVSRKHKLLDTQKLLEHQQEMERKYGLREHKRLRVEYLYTLNHPDVDELQTQESGGMYQ